MATEVKQLSEFDGVPEDILNAAAGVVLPEGHGNPHLGRLLKAFRQVNGVSQVDLAKGQVEGIDEGLTTTHAQIAMLEQGGAKRGAQDRTLKLISQATHIPEASLVEMNKLDIADRVKPAPAPETSGGESTEGSSEGDQPEATKSTSRRHGKAGNGKATEKAASADAPEPVAL